MSHPAARLAKATPRVAHALGHLPPVTSTAYGPVMARGLLAAADNRLLQRSCASTVASLSAVASQPVVTSCPVRGFAQRPYHLPQRGGDAVTALPAWGSRRLSELFELAPDRVPGTVGGSARGSERGFARDSESGTQLGRRQREHDNEGAGRARHARRRVLNRAGAHLDATALDAGSTAPGAQSRLHAQSQTHAHPQSLPLRE